MDAPATLMMHSLGVNTIKKESKS